MKCKALFKLRGVIDTATFVMTPGSYSRVNGKTETQAQVLKTFLPANTV